VRRWLAGRGLALVATIGVNLLLIAGMARLNSYAKTRRAAVEKPPPVAIPLVKRKITEQRARPRPRPSTGPRRRPALPTLNIPSSVQLPQWEEVQPAGEAEQRVEVLRPRLSARRVLDADAVDEPPRVLVSAPPRYPAQAEAQGIEGEVVARILVDAEGSVRQVTILSSRPEEVFDRAAVEALQKWRFTPAKLQGRAVRVWARKRVVFKLN